MLKYSALRMAVYFVLIIVVVLMGKMIPPLGVSRDFLSENHYERLTENMSGVFIESPQVPLVFGFLYFTLLAFFDAWKLFKNKPIEQ